MENNNRKESWDKEMSIAQIFGQMFTGSVVAGVLVGVPVVFIVGLSWLGEYLPEESKLADDFKLQSEALTDFSQKHFNVALLGFKMAVQDSLTVFNTFSMAFAVSFPDSINTFFTNLS